MLKSPEFVEEASFDFGMDLITGLEGMAQDVVDVERWQKLFGFSYEEASHELTAYRENKQDSSISDEGWQAVEEVQKALGHDKESYGYAKSRGKAMMASAKRSVDKNSMWLLKLEGPLSNAGQVRIAGGLRLPPKVFSGTDSDSMAQHFCLVDGETKRRILDHFEHEVDCQTFVPTFIRDHRAKKELSADSKYPTLGIDTTLPQHRPSVPKLSVAPAQDQYPVWYFFYGTLGDSEFLARLLDLQEYPEYRAAHVSGGQLTTWGGVYKALIDSTVEKNVWGVAYHILCKEHEESLRIYETDRYEVVRVTIVMDDGGECEEVPGLTFRFIEER